MMLPELTPDLTAVEAGRLMMAQQLQKIVFNAALLRETADPVAVHEMRKAIRRTFTAFRLFASYYAPDTLAQHRRGLRRMMRRLGRSRDLTVFRAALDSYNAGQERLLLTLSAYFAEQQTLADEAVQAYLERPKWESLLRRYDKFCATPGLGTAVAGQEAPPLIAHIAPAMLYTRLALVRATGAHLDALSVPQLHQLRIQFKELRYALDFLSPILGPGTAGLLVSLNDVQDHLGMINDSRVALLLLDEVPSPAGEVAEFRAFQTAALARQAASFAPVWAEIDSPQWRRALATAVAEV